MTKRRIYGNTKGKTKEAAEYVLRLCTGIPDLTIVSSDIQKSLRNLFGKSAIDPEDTRFGALSETIREQKGVKEEIVDMCRAVEDYARERAEKREIETKVEFVSNLLAEGFDLEKALKIADIDEETYRRYSEKK